MNISKRSSRRIERFWIALEKFLQLLFVFVFLGRTYLVNVIEDALLHLRVQPSSGRMYSLHGGDLRTYRLRNSHVVVQYYNFIRLRCS